MSNELFYRYYGGHGLDVVRNLRLKVTPLDRFNDPFECCPWFDYGGIPADDQIPSFIEEVSRSYGLICFTREGSNILMWSHYANGHKGILIGFDPKHSFFQQHDWVDADYQTERTRFHPDLISTPAGKHKFAEALVSRKFNCWGYEKEFRILKRLQECVPDGEHRFLGIPKELILSVTFGLRCPLKKREEILVAMRDNGLRPQLQQARRHNKDFALIYEPICAE